jgi:tRNA G18 (ribose-2'-O)-methylase SpoU
MSIFVDIKRLFTFQIIHKRAMRKLLHHEIAKQRFTAAQLRSLQRFPIFVLLDNIRSLYNVGSIFRTSDGARIEKLYLTGYTPYPPRREIEKTALGSTSTVPWEYRADPMSVIRQLRENGTLICVVEHTDSCVPYYTLTRDRFPLCLVIGNEISGIRSEIIEEADLSIEVPMFGLKQSLNVAVAYGIVVFDLVRIINGTGPRHRS